MIKKQQGLNIHLIPCDKFRQRFQLVCSSSLKQDVDDREFCAILAACKLLKADFSKKDERWMRFYSKFVVMDQGSQEGEWRKRYSLVPTQIALIFLAQGTSDIKARAICDLFDSNDFLSPSPANSARWKEDEAERRNYQG